MRRPLLFFFLQFLFYNFNGYAQSKFEPPAFGQAVKADLLLNECDFDKNAEALVLFDVEEVVCKEYPHTIYAEIKRHIRIKILKNKGLEVANIKIPYLSGSDMEHISIDEAQTYNLDGSGNILITKLDKKAVVDKSVFKKISEKIFSFPEARPGSVIEYTYTKSGPVESGLRNWNFQTSIPVKFSRYKVNFPDNIEMVCRPHCTLPVEEENSTTSTAVIKVFTMTNVPALRDEPFMSCEEDYMQRIESDVIAITLRGYRTNLTRSWSSVIENLMNDEDFGLQLNRNIPRTDDLDDSLKNIKDPYRKMNIIYRYVRRNMHWDGHSNIWALDGVRSAWKNKKGTTGEINLILENLLKDAGLLVYPILVSTRTNGRINFSMPGWQQFDKVMVLVIIDDHNYVLDATDQFTSPKLIPWEVMYSDGLVLEKVESFKWGWRTLWDENDAFKDLIMIQANINEEGIMSGEATVSSYDYSRAKRMKGLKDGKEQFVEKYFDSRNGSLHIDSSQITNEAIDTLPLKQKVWFNEKLSSSGNYKYFSTNLFTGLEENPFTSDHRFTDIFFGANQKYTIVESFFIPDGYAFEEMPKNVRMIMPDTSIVFTRIISAQNDLLNLQINLEFKKPVFGVDEYDAFREFYKKLFAMLNEQIVIKKVN